jgi:integrase
MSIRKKSDGVYEVRWREGGRNRSLSVHGGLALAQKIERKRMSVRDENRHLDIKKEVNFRMTDLIDRYWEHYGSKKRSAEREKSIIEGIRAELGKLFAREVDGIAVSRWYERLTAVQGLSDGTAVRHFNVMHHMMKKASTIWTKETGLERNPADSVEVRRPDDARERYLSESELRRLKAALDDNWLRKGTKDVNRTNRRMRLIVLIALTTGMRASEIFGLRWPDVMYDEGLLAVRAKLKGGKMRYVPLLPEVASDLRQFPEDISDDRLFPPRKGAEGKRRRLEGSFEDLLNRARISNFRFHDLRHTFASWYMMNGGDLYELAKILGHANIKMTERYAKLGRQHIARTGNTARELWKLLEKEECVQANIG